MSTTAESGASDTLAALANQGRVRARRIDGAHPGPVTLRTQHGTLTVEGEPDFFSEIGPGVTRVYRRDGWLVAHSVVGSFVDGDHFVHVAPHVASD